MTKPTLPAGLPADILTCIMRYTDPDIRVRKEDIAAFCGLEYNETTDRNIREAVTELRKQGHPVCSDSGKAGYYYNPDLIDHTIAEYESRASEMFEIARAMRRGYVPEKVRQLELVCE